MPNLGFSTSASAFGADIWKNNEATTTGINGSRGAIDRSAIDSIDNAPSIVSLSNLGGLTDSLTENFHGLPLARTNGHHSNRVAHQADTHFANLLSEMALDPSSFFPSLNGSSLSNGGGNTNGGVAPIAGLFNIQQSAPLPLPATSIGNELGHPLAADVALIGTPPNLRFCTCEERPVALYHCRDCDDYLCEPCKDAHKRVKLTRDHSVLAYNNAAPVAVGQSQPQSGIIRQTNAATPPTPPINNNNNHSRISMSAITPTITDVSVQPSNGCGVPSLLRENSMNGGFNSQLPAALNGGNAILFGILPLPGNGQLNLNNLNRLNITFDGHSIGNGTPNARNGCPEPSQIRSTSAAGRDYAEIMQNGPLFSFGSEGSGDGQLCRPWGIVIDKRYRVVVADRSNNRIQIFNKDGKYLTKFGTSGNAKGQFNRPAGVCVNSHNHIIVADKDNHRIQVFTENGEFILEFGCRGRQNSHFNYPWGVATNQFNHIAVTDTRNHRIQIFDASGQFLRKVGYEHNYFFKNLDSPRGIVFTRDDNVMVTDFNNHRVAILPKIGYPNELKVFGSEGTDGGQFMRPQGMTIDHMGNILVCDSKNNRIQVFTPDEYRCIAVFGQSSQVVDVTNLAALAISAPNSAKSSSIGSMNGHSSAHPLIAQFSEPPPPLPGSLPRSINGGSSASPPNTPPNAFGGHYDLPSPFHNGTTISPLQQQQTPISPPSLFSLNANHGGNISMSSPSTILSATTTTTSLGSSQGTHGSLSLASYGPGGLLPSSKTAFLNNLNGVPNLDPPLLDRPTDLAIAPDGRVYVVDFGHSCIRVF
ncbi:hypothetical protein WR25_21233 isoform A [Diploscapter pachys]|uniref:B box-type domain-containing protein n=1 Tax=Diploscapter pachys TaxID=2018661 RepID=A0A2A2JD21_9BILA|nr:hypothetical protein WR25_21233 isoform A [Diploscapter pachys]